MNRAAEPAKARLLPPRARIVPIAAVMAGSLLATLPIVTTVPLLPPFGLLMLLAWRLLRSELWQAWIALPLGLFDDLFSGQPLGSAVVLWTLALLAADLVDNRALWRDYWLDWMIAGVILALGIIGAWGIVAITTGADHRLLVVPEITSAITCCPAAMRICAAMDRWRLRR